MSYQTQTSLPAYKSILPSLNDKQRQVLEAIKWLNQGGPVNDRMIAEFIGWPINTITPRRNELEAKGMIYEFKKDKDPITGRTTSFWKVSTNQLNLF